MIGIICATDDEILHLLGDMLGSSETIIGIRKFYSGSLYGKNAVLVRSNVGKTAAAVTVAIIAEHFHVDGIIFTGMAGAVADELSLGDAVVATSLVQHDFRLFGEYPAKIPYLGKAYFECDERLSDASFLAAEKYLTSGYKSDIPENILHKFKIVAPKVFRGIIASGDEFISDSAKKEAIRSAMAPICVEMEGAAAAQASYELSIPIAVIRIISDAADEDSEYSYNSFVEQASSLFTRGIIRELLSKEL
ncbi:MAG: 5'-methylthioadenosine/adenosylhomocysteine nucleosidase [Oscillospiraceae bacterium]|nr:5'-methylthioadenosine/adenosylhomocysteine nucleosidase [Oscillospiraceae bacterium]